MGMAMFTTDVPAVKAFSSPAGIYKGPGVCRRAEQLYQLRAMCQRLSSRS